MFAFSYILFNAELACTSLRIDELLVLMSYRQMICIFIEFNKSAVICTFVVCSVDVNDISITSYRVIQSLDVYEKF